MKNGHIIFLSLVRLSTFYPQSGPESGLGESMTPQTPHYPMESRLVPGQPSPDVSEILSDNQEDGDLWYVEPCQNYWEYPNWITSVYPL